MSNALIRKAFETRAATWAAAQTPPIPVAFFNAPFVVPPANGRYARTFMLPGKTVSLGIDQTVREYTGVWQVSITLPINTGCGVIDVLEASLDAVFTPVMVQDGFKIWVISPVSQVPPIQELNNVVVPLTMSYKAEAVH